jgi:catechol 2,3-dioxygenase-like lactoylglutathione lyase family enzyme
MRINLTSVLVDDQDKALRFYTDVLGFEKKTEVPLGEHRWLTVVSPDDPDGTELVLEPDAHPAAKVLRRRWSATASPTRPSPWTTSPPSLPGWSGSACGSRSSPPRWDR